MMVENTLQPEHVRFPKLLKVQEVADILNISRSMAYKLVQQGVVPSLRLGSAVRVNLDDLKQFIRMNTAGRE